MRFGFIGGGVMAEALIRAILDRGLASPDAVAVADPIEARRAALASLGVRVTGANADAAVGADMVVLAVKPDLVPAVLEVLSTSLTPAQLVLSIAPGVSLRNLEA